MARIGYARVSTKNQNDDSQVDELNAHGVGKLFVDHRVSGEHASRPHLDAAQELVRILPQLVEAVQVRLSFSGEPDEARDQPRH